MASSETMEFGIHWVGEVLRYFAKLAILCTVTLHCVCFCVENYSAI